MNPFEEVFRHKRRVQEANKEDPDDGNSWLCVACNLPIFSTPFETTSKNNTLFRLHDQCAQLPAKLEDHALHPGYPLFLKESENPAVCTNCNRQCGSMYYHCPNNYCRVLVLLDILCAREINMIMHKGHKHRMMAMSRLRDPATLVCDACGTRHAVGDADRDPSYLCKLCNFWIHPKCASFSNAVFLITHHHTLFLNYHDDDTYDDDDGDDFYLQKYECAICGDEEQGSGYFFCPKCSYHAHIRCAMSHPTVKPVLIRNVKNSELLRLPMPNEHASLTRYILQNTTSYSTDEGKLRLRLLLLLQSLVEADGLDQHPLVFHNQEKEKDEDKDKDKDGPHQCNACVKSISPPFYTCSICPDLYLHASCLNLPTEIKHHASHEENTLVLLPKSPNLGSHISYLCHSYILGNSTSTNTSNRTSTSTDELHQHRFVFHEEVDKDGPHQCNACVQSISPPFYTCSICPDFYLHNSCLNLPTEIKHPAHKQHTLILLPQPPDFCCDGCECVCNGFVYVCEYCDFCLDVICALMPAAITHESHGKSHILYMRYTGSSYKCSCCDGWLSGIWYKCSSCRDFKLHATCALLPSTLAHKFDDHPLNLTTNTRPHQICEICEQEDMDERLWCYSCDECDHSFHIDCIPCVDRYSRVKLGESVSVSVPDHECPCPLKLIRSTTVYGYRCLSCNNPFDDSQHFAYECFNCYFRVHSKCTDNETLLN